MIDGLPVFGHGSKVSSLTRELREPRVQAEPCHGRAQAGAYGLKAASA